MAKILILGGTRYVGKRLVNRLIENGDSVTVASTGKTEVTFAGDVSRIIFDRRSVSSMYAAFSRQSWEVVYDHICYSAAEAQCAVDLFSGQVGKLIMISSQSVYDEGAALKESAFDPVGYPGNSANENPYQEGKRLAEQVFARQTSLQVSMVRFPIILGEDDYTKRLHWHVDRIKRREPFCLPNPDARISFVDSEDAAKFLFWLGRARLSGPVNAASPEPVRLVDLMRDIAEVHGGQCLSAIDDGKNGSPFGIEADWYMDVAKVQEAGYRFAPVKSWLPDLVRKI